MQNRNCFTQREGLPVATDRQDVTADWLATTLEQILDGQRELRELLAGRSKPLLTIEEVAELTGRTSYTVRRWVKEGRLTATRVSGTGPRGRLLVAREQVQRLVAAGLGAEVPADVVGS
jgi:excisionase family DNA binding protein